jgi:phenylpyruvate tautomerase PptA (4-oxalocrotonate tautomerase family)
MPIYQCLSAAGVVTDELKPRIAKEITRLHCEATKAPPSFVHVLFQELDAGQSYLAGELDTKTSWINGLIRSGRTLEVRQQLMKDMCRSWTDLTGQPADQLLVNLRETDASMAMEAGLILPDPGQEAEWFNEHRAQLGRLSPDGIQGL